MDKRDRKRVSMTAFSSFLSSTNWQNKRKEEENEKKEASRQHYWNI